MPPDLEFFQELRGVGVGKLGLTRQIGIAVKAYLNGLRLPTLFKGAYYSFQIRRMTVQERRVSPYSTLYHADMAADLFSYQWRREEPRFASLVLYPTDGLAHQFWIDFEPKAFEPAVSPHGDKYGWVLGEAYKQADRVLGRMMDTLPDDVLLVVLSDHGSKANLETFSRYSIRPEPLISALDMEGRVSGYAVGRLLQMRSTEVAIAKEEPEFVRILREASVDGQPLLVVEPGTPPFFRVSVAGNPSLEQEGLIGGKKLPLNQLLQIRKVSGDHTREGILGFWGNDVQPGEIETAHLIDVAPTLLNYLRLPRSSIMKGRFLREGFRNRALEAMTESVVDSYSFDFREMRGVPGESSEAEIKKRLRALGYLE